MPQSLQPATSSANALGCESTLTSVGLHGASISVRDVQGEVTEALSNRVTGAASSFRQHQTGLVSSCAHQKAGSPSLATCKKLWKPRGHVRGITTTARDMPVLAVLLPQQFRPNALGSLTVAVGSKGQGHAHGQCQQAQPEGNTPLHGCSSQLDVHRWRMNGLMNAIRSHASGQHNQVGAAVLEDASKLMQTLSERYV